MRCYSRHLQNHLQITSNIAQLLVLVIIFAPLSNFTIKVVIIKNELEIFKVYIYASGSFFFRKVCQTLGLKVE